MVIEFTIITFVWASTTNIILKDYTNKLASMYE